MKLKVDTRVKPCDETGKLINFGDYIIRGGQQCNLQYSRVIGWNKGFNSHLLRVASVRYNQHKRCFYTSEGILKMPSNCLIISSEVLPIYARAQLSRLEIDKE